MAGSSRKKSDNSSGALPADVDLETLYGAVGGDAAEEEDEPVMVPPVRLLPREELAAAALRVPLLATAIRLAHWVAPSRPVDQWGELGAELETLAAVELGLVPDDGDSDTALARVAEAWSLAVDLELIEVSDADGDAAGAAGAAGAAEDAEAAEGAASEGAEGGEVARPGVGLTALGSLESACPLTDVIEDQARTATDGLVQDLRINWVWMPPWGPDKITPDGRDQLRALGFNV
jgi:hypothetical protein